MNNKKHNMKNTKTKNEEMMRTDLKASLKTTFISPESNWHHPQ